MFGSRDYEMVHLGKLIDEKHKEMGDLAMKILMDNLSPEKSEKVIDILQDASRSMLHNLQVAIDELDKMERPPVQVMYVKPSLPDFVFEEHRYTEPRDGWVFTRLHPQEDGDESPFGYHDEPSMYESKGEYLRIVDGWMRAEPAEVYRQQLIDAGYRKVEWSDVPTEVIVYNESRVVPMEWQNDPDFCKEMSWVWIKGEWPL